MVKEKAGDYCLGNQPTNQPAGLGLGQNGVKEIDGVWMNLRLDVCKCRRVGERNVWICAAWSTVKRKIESLYPPLLCLFVYSSINDRVVLLYLADYLPYLPCIIQTSQKKPPPHSKASLRSSRAKNTPLNPFFNFISKLTDTVSRSRNTFSFAKRDRRVMNSFFGSNHY